MRVILCGVLPSDLTTTEEMGRATIAVARQGTEKRVLESRDIGAPR